MSHRCNVTCPPAGTRSICFLYWDLLMKDPWTPSQFALGERPVPPQRPARAPRHQPGEHFLKGPIPLAWMSRAGQLPGKALHVGIALWYLSGLHRGSPTVALCGAVLATLGVTRTIGYRALKALEDAGLVGVERQPGRYPRVTLLAGGTDHG